MDPDMQIESFSTPSYGNQQPCLTTLLPPDEEEWEEEHGSPADSAHDDSPCTAPVLSPFDDSVYDSPEGSSQTLSPFQDSAYGSSPAQADPVRFEEEVEIIVNDLLKDQVNDLLKEQQQIPLVQIQLKPGVEQLHRFRTAKEMQQEHGGYLEGSIVLPVDFMNRKMSIWLSTIPENLDTFRVHPCMLRIRVYDSSSTQRNKKTIFKTPLDSANDWKIELEVDRGQVFYKPNGGTVKYPIVNALQVNNKTQEKENVILLGSGNCEVTIITTLQGKTKDGGVTVDDVIKTRLREEEITDVNANEMTKKFLSRQDTNHDLTKVRLRAQVVDLDSGISGEAISEVITDKGKVSDLKFISGPGSWCNRGGLDMIMAATKTLGDAVLILEDKEGGRTALQQAYPKANQIIATGPTYDSFSGTCKFQIPSQPDCVVQALANDQRKLKLTMKKGKHSSQYCDRVFDFKYVAHQVNHGCPYCAISGLLADYEPLKQQQIKRKHESDEILEDVMDMIGREGFVHGILEKDSTNADNNSTFMAQQQQLPDCSPTKKWCGPGGGGICEIMSGGGSIFNDPSRIVHDDCKQAQKCRQRKTVSNEIMDDQSKELKEVKAVKYAQAEKEEDVGSLLSSLVNSVQYAVGTVFRWIIGKML